MTGLGDEIHVFICLLAVPVTWSLACFEVGRVVAEQKVRRELKRELGEMEAKVRHIELMAQAKGEA